MFTGESKVEDPTLDATAEDTIVFELKVKCRKNPQAGKDVTDPEEKYIDSKGMPNSYKFVKLYVKAIMLRY
jgi:hypothetical protein